MRPRFALHLACLALLVMGAVRGQTYPVQQYNTGTVQAAPSTVTRRAEPCQPLHCDARFIAEVGGGAYTGSAVVAGTGPGVTYLLTNHHNVESGGNIGVIIGSQRHPAQVLATDQANDLAVLRINGNLPYVGIASQMPPEGTVLTCRSFDCGEYCVRWTGTFAGHNESGAALLNSYAVGGNSGGGVYHDGRLVGIMWGNSNKRMAFSDIRPIRAILQRAGCTPVEGQSASQQNCRRCVGGVCSPQYYAPQYYQQPRHYTQPQPRYQAQPQPQPQTYQQPVPAYDPPQPSDPGPATSATPQPERQIVDLPPCNCDENWKTLNARIDARIEAKSPFPTASIVESIKSHEARLEQLEAKVEVALAQSGTPGERGPAGPQGPQGEPGKDAALDPALQNRISQLEAELVALKDRKIRLELHKDGELIGVSEGTHTVRVNINELEK